MADDEISEEGRRARFAQWEKLGLDQVKHDLLNGGHRVVGGPPQVRALAWEWVRQKEAERDGVTRAPGNATEETLTLGGEVGDCGMIGASITLTGPDAAKFKEAAREPNEILTLKPTIYGIGVDLKEVGRRIRQRFKKP